jgi:ankyrin repeat protein
MKSIVVIALILLSLHPAASGQSTSTDIHEAARKGDLDQVTSMLASADTLLEATDILGDTPLTLAAAYGRWDVFKYLLDAGADVNVTTRTNSTPMHCACYHDRPDMVELLFEKGGGRCLKVGDVYGEYTPMLRAVQRGCKNVVALLFEKGAGPEESTKEGWNALHLAAKCGHRHLYGLLIEKGVSLDAKDKDGNVPMAYDFRRPDAIEIESRLYPDYVGFYTWEGAPEGLGVDVFMDGGKLVLDDNCLNVLYPIAEDTFYCSQDPWKINFYRNDAGLVDRIELHFLRRSVMLQRL